MREPYGVLCSAARRTLRPDWHARMSRSSASQGGTMRSKLSIAAALAAILTVSLAAVTALPGPAARADQMYHSHQIALHPVGDEPLRSGFVENIHASGPIIFEHEIYVLNGAEPATTYQVTLNIFPFNPTCAGSAGVVLPPRPSPPTPQGTAAVMRSSIHPTSLRTCATPRMAPSGLSPIPPVPNSAPDAR